MQCKHPIDIYNELRRSSDHDAARRTLDELDATGFLAEDPESSDPEVLKERYVALGVLCNACMGPTWLQSWGQERAIETLRRFFAGYTRPHTNRTVYRWLAGAESWIKHESDWIYHQAVNTPTQR